VSTHPPEQPVSQAVVEAGRLGDPPPPPEVLVELRDLHKSFGDARILTGVSLAVPRGISAVVMGGSGTGKSVLIKHVVQLLKPDRGEVWAMGKRVDELQGDELDALRLSTGYLFQGGALFDSMTVYENLDFILDRHTNLSRSERRERIEETLEWVNLKQSILQFPAELSGGQKKRAALARSVILKPELMLYDEPTTGLDPVSVRVVSELIVRLREERGITSITITHDLLCTEIISDVTYFLHEGQFVAGGTLDELKRSERPELRNFFGH
jgi:phospholipid/cholesterol/gamma-HCH transport system ATP-binding protein